MYGGPGSMGNQNLQGGYPQHQNQMPVGQNPLQSTQIVNQMDQAPGQIDNPAMQNQHL